MQVLSRPPPQAGVAPARAKPPAMTEHVASRTLVKSPPELWAECSDAASLARHLDQFGDIRITRLDPETAVAWEGERARGTVRIEPSGWGTKVILTAEAVGEAEVVAEAAEEVVPEAEQSEPEPIPEPEPELELEPEPAPPPRRRRFSRLLGFLRGPEPPPADPEEPLAPEQAPDEPATPDEPVAHDEPVTSHEPAASATEPATGATEPATDAALTAALDSLGQAHHRPYSRA
jgi:hypothetical protein